MKIVDIHTHRLRKDAIVARRPDEPLPEGYLFSVGVHPWHAGMENVALLPGLLGREDVVAIGECGLDSLRGPEATVQREVFEAQAAMASELDMPLIIHCVKAVDGILAVKRRLKPANPWIFHGFRGKPQQALQLIDNGFYLSFGPRFNPQSAAAIPPERLLIETDDTDADISAVAQAVAEARTTGQEEIMRICSENVSKILKRRG